MKECLVCAKCFNDSSSYCSEDGNPLKRTLTGDILLDGRYQLRRRLGQGGMGVVYKARHLFLKTTHAIKVILPDLVGNDSEFLTRFRQEAMAAAAIRHHNIIAVTDYGVVNNSMPFLVMEYIQGKSLHEVLVKEGKLTPERALEIMEPIAAGVGAAHRRSIVHRDLKPLNIMIEDELPIDEAVKLLDFGLAKIKSGELLGSFVAAKTTGLMGSPFYMAPEQWSEEEPDKCADIYSLGIILYQMLAGDVPFKGPSIPSIMKKHLLEKPPHFAELGATVPPEVEEVVRHTLEKDPGHRPPTVQSFINELREAVNASSVTQKALRDHMANLLATLPRTTDDQLAGTISSDFNIEVSARQNIEISSRQPEANALVEERHKREEQEKSRQTETEEQQRLRHEAENQARLEAEARRRQQEEEDARRRAEEEARQKREHEESERRAAEAAARKQAEEEAARKQAEEEAARKKAEEEAARKKAEEEEAARKKAEEEAARRRAEEEEAARKQAEEEAARRRAEEEEAARKKAEEEAARLAEQERLRAEAKERARLEAEARRRAEEEARKKAEEEAARLAAEEEARKRAEEEQRRREEEAEAARRAAAEAKRKRAEQEAHARWLAELAAKERERKEEEERLEAEAKRKQEAERQRQREEEEQRQRAEEEERLRKLEEEEAARKRAEEEEAARKLEEERANRKRAEEEAERQRIAEAERQRVAEEAERERVAKEARRRAEEEARKRAKEEEARRLAEAQAARVRAETEARRKQLEEEERRKTEAERARLEEEARRRREAEAGRAERQPPGSEDGRQSSREATAENVAPFVAQHAAQVVTQHAPESDFLVTRTAPAPLPPDGSSSLGTHSLPSIEVAPHESSRMVVIGIAAVVVVLLLGGGGAALYLATRPAQSDQSQQTKPQNRTTAADRSGANPNGDKTTPAQSRLVLIPGGVFQMGRNDVSKTSLDYNQYPAHPVSVKSFYLDKTEVTNAEYAEFVRATGHPAPKAPAAPYWTPWNGAEPPAGQEQWPVRNVSVADAVAFAAWRTKRDNVTYRLPTEEEWEYAARNGGEGTLYPWGQKWVGQSANVDAALPMPVGSFVNGATRTGALDMIGNVWEWTASEASIYPGNNEREIKTEDKGQVIVRGGSYQSKASGGEPITAASRQWVPRETKHPTIGFRLVRDSPDAP